MEKHKQRQKKGRNSVSVHDADAVPGVRLLADDQTIKRLAKVGHDTDTDDAAFIRKNGGLGFAAHLIAACKFS